MKKVILLSVTAMLLFSCGPSQEELDKQQHIQDSLHEIERENIIDKTNNYFDSDTSRIRNQDSIK